MKYFFNAIFLVFLTFGSIFAHESRPVLIQIKQDKTLIHITYSVPNTVDFRNLPHLILPKSFQKNSTKNTIKTNNEGFYYEDIFIGNILDLKGQKLLWKFPYFNPTLSAVVQIYYQNLPETVVLNPQNEILDLREKAHNSIKSNAFLGLGIEHIFRGIDHLLFVLCLLLITGKNKKLLWTITGFTIAHSITLFLSVMGWVQIPVPFVEVCIALSILFLCNEIIQNSNQQIPQSLTYQYPFLVSSLFGLIHGLGFAAVLAEIGLPKDNQFSALLFFNIGVEIGQLIFLAAIIVLIWLINRIPSQTFKKYQIYYPKILTYGIGITASFWFFERLSNWYK